MKKLVVALLGTLCLTSLLAPAKEPNTGYLKVNANPASVQVYVDGQLLGAAAQNNKVRKFELPQGAHTIRLVQEGYLESTQHIYVTPGHLTALGVALSPHSGSGATEKAPTPAGR